MRSWLPLLLLLFSGASLAADGAPPAPGIAGHWQFYMKIYQGIEMPESPSATLRLHFEFSQDGVSRLYWWHEGDSDHCRREGRYRVEGSTLVDEVTWVDPENTFGCGSDPDMQLGRVTRTPFSFRADDLVLDFHLGDEPLYMVWKRIGAVE